MAVSATRKITITYAGDLTASHVIDAPTNSTSPAQIEVLTLSSGDNTIAVPGGGTTARSVTIVPPSGNTTAITLKGVVGDTGIRLHDTDPSTITLHSSVANLVLNAGASIQGVRLFWT